MPRRGGGLAFLFLVAPIAGLFVGTQVNENAHHIGWTGPTRGAVMVGAQILVLLAAIAFRYSALSRRDAPLLVVEIGALVVMFAGYVITAVDEYNDVGAETSGRRLVVVGALLAALAGIAFVVRMYRAARVHPVVLAVGIVLTVVLAIVMPGAGVLLVLVTLRAEPRPNLTQDDRVSSVRFGG